MNYLERKAEPINQQDNKQGMNQRNVTPSYSPPQSSIGASTIAQIN